MALPDGGSRPQFAGISISAEDMFRTLVEGRGKPRLITGDEVEFHDGQKISLPRGMTYDRAFSILKRLEEEAETKTQFNRVFRFRADDGAYAAFQTIKDKWGLLLGKATHTFFGTIWPESKTINIGVGQTMQVPWGRIEIPHLDGLEMFLHEAQDRDYGKVFGIHVEGPRKYKDEVESFFDEVQEYLTTKSIYRGRALVGSDELEFLDLDLHDPKQVVYSDAVTEQLDALVHAPIRYAEAMRREGVSLKQAVLLAGPFGTGKTSEGMTIAQIAVEHGWTFISAKPGRDKVEDVLRTARLYQPAVVFIEDIDTSTSSGEDDDVTKFLDAFDGITAKGGEMLAVMTTNYAERIHKGMLRPGRIDAVIEIAELDRGGVERLIKAIVDPTKLDPGVDYDAVYAEMENFLPAFVRGAVSRAVSFAITRIEGGGTYIIDTSDLVASAKSLQPQLKQLMDAGEGAKRPTLDQAVRDTVQDAAKGLGVYSMEYHTVGAIVDKPAE